MSRSTESVLVTGATSGIGRAICLRFAADGDHVLIHGKDEKKGSEVAREVVAAGGSAEVVIADLREPAAIETLVAAALGAKHPLKLLVNNAGGVLGEQSFVPGTLNDVETTFAVNVFAPYRLSTMLAETMTGSIVNITSVNGHVPLMGARIPLYSSSKAALSHLTQMLAIKLAPKIRVNAVSPGRTLTSAWGDMDPEWEADVVNDALIERWITPEEIAEAVWFLHHNEACTGMDMVLDGGIGLKGASANT